MSTKVDPKERASKAPSAPWEALLPAFTPAELSTITARGLTSLMQFAEDMSAELDADASRVGSTSTADEELLNLVSKIEGIARSTRHLVEHPEAYAPFDPSGQSLARRKADCIVRLAAMYNTWLATKPPTPWVGRPERMTLTEAVVLQGELERAAPTHDLAAKRARRLASGLSVRYPALKRQLAARHEFLRIAILASAKRKTMPWKEILAAWNGIEGAAVTIETWRSDWAEHKNRT